MKPLASNNIINVLFFPAVVLLLLSLLTISGASTMLMGVPFTVFLFVVLGLWVYFGVRETCNVFYDDEFVYLEGIGHSSKVPLTQVKRIARDQSGMKASGVTAWRYILEFTSASKVAPQTFHEIDGGTKLTEFVRHLRTINPKVVVE